MQRLKKMAAAAAPRVISFCPFCAILGIFANFARFWAFFAHILCANFSDSKFCMCYFVSFFHLCLTVVVSSLCPGVPCLLPHMQPMTGVRSHQRNLSWLGKDGLDSCVQSVFCVFMLNNNTVWGFHIILS